VTGNLQFTATASSNKGFVRVSPRDSRFLEFENGESFIPNSSGRQYWRNDKRSSYYEQSFTEFKQYGVNFTRIWDQNDGYGLTVEGHFDAYKWPDDYKPDTDAIAAALPKGTQMNQRGNYDEDIIIESARQNGVYIELSSKGEPYWIWDASVYDEGWNPNPVRFDNQQHLNYWKRNYRYRIARWGYATSIATWEVWNEHGHISAGSETWNFYTDLAKYIKDTDPYDHLVTTSQGSQAWSPAFWSTPGMDVVNYHDYMMPGRYNNVYDAADFVYRFMQCLRMTNGSTCGLSLGDGSNASGPQKPIIWGELDTGTSAWNEPNPQPKATHAMRWAGLFSPGGTTGIDWYWDSQSASFMATKHAEAKIASDFFKDIDYAGKKFTYLSTSDVKLTSETVQTSNTLLRVLAMKAQNNSEAYAWVQNKNNARWDQGINTTPISASFTLNGMTQGTYTIQTWDTYSGQITTSTIQANNGSITIPVTNLSKDIALKITTGQISTVSPTAQIKIGDANNDTKVDGRDYIVWLNNYGSSTTIGPNKGDFNSSGRIDGVDYILWLNNYGM